MTPHALLAPARLAGQPILRTQSDERLVDLVRAGSEPAFEAIVARYRRPLLRYCARILPAERAEDAVQQTFVRAYRAMRRGGADLSLRPWLYRIAHNTALNALRDRGLRHEELDDQLDSVEPPDRVLERSQSLREVLTAVQALPERQRDAIVLRELEGRSYDEIASELGVSDGAVRQLLNRARNTLRAAASAVTPTGLAMRIPWMGGGDGVGVRVAELCGAGGGGALIAKVCATALVTGAVLGGGVTVAPDFGKDEAVAETEQAEPSGGPDHPRPVAPVGGQGASGSQSAGDSLGGESEVEDSSGHGSGDGDDNSGSGSNSSGSGSSGSGSSGSGSSGSGEYGSGSGSGYDSSGSGSGYSSGSGGGGYDSSGSGSGYYSSGSGGGGYDSSGSGSSGSGSSGSGEYQYQSDSGSGSSGSGSSGSGSSGSDSSGSGSSGSGSSGSDSSGSVSESE